MDTQTHNTTNHVRYKQMLVVHQWNGSIVCTNNSPPSRQAIINAVIAWCLSPTINAILTKRHNTMNRWFIYDHFGHDHQETNDWTICACFPIAYPLAQRKSRFVAIRFVVFGVVLLPRGKIADVFSENKAISALNVNCRSVLPGLGRFQLESRASPKRISQAFQ